MLRRSNLARVLGVSAFFAFLVGVELSSHRERVINYDELRFTRMPIEMLVEGRLTPTWFGHPASPHITLNYLAIASVYGARLALNQVGPSRSLKRDFFSNPLVYVRTGQVLSAFISWLVLLLLYFSVFRWAGEFAAVVAVGCLGLVPAFAPYSVIARPDSIAMFFTLLVAILSTRLLNRRPDRTILLAVGAALGLSVATKYTLVVNAVLPFMALALRASKEKENWLQSVSLIGVSAIVVFFLITPGILLSPLESLSTLRNEVTMDGVARSRVSPFATRLWNVFTVSLPRVVVRPAFFAVFGVFLSSVVFLRREALAVGVYVAVFLVLSAVPPFAKVYWFLPMMPPVAAVIGWTLSRLWTNATWPHLLPRRIGVALFCGAFAAHMAIRRQDQFFPAPAPPIEQFLEEKMAAAAHAGAKTVFHNFRSWGVSSHFVASEFFEQRKVPIVHALYFNQFCLEKRILRGVNRTIAEFIVLDVSRSKATPLDAPCIASLLSSGNVCDSLNHDNGDPHVLFLRANAQVRCPSTFAAFK